MGVYAVYDNDGNIIKWIVASPKNALLQQGSDNIGKISKPKSQLDKKFKVKMGPDKKPLLANGSLQLVNKYL